MRAEQTEHRRTLNIFTEGDHNTIRVAPMFHQKIEDVARYVCDNDLPDNDVYFDPTKGPVTRECGLLLRKGAKGAKAPKDSQEQTQKRIRVQ